MSNGISEEKTLYDFSAKRILGDGSVDFNQFRDKVVIVVNGASQCGYTKSNYAGLSSLLDSYYDQGLRVLVFPCNQFMNQEREGPEKIKEYIDQFDKRFVVAEKVDVLGSDIHPIFAWLKDKCPGFLVNTIKWNFTKFLVDRKGVPVERFAPNDEPSKMVTKVEQLLQQQQ